MLLHGRGACELVKLFLGEALMLFEERDNGSEGVWFAVEKISAKPWHIGSVFRPPGARLKNQFQGLKAAFVAVIIRESPPIGEVADEAIEDMPVFLRDMVGIRTCFQESADDFGKSSVGNMAQETISLIRWDGLLKKHFHDGFTSPPDGSLER
jgi:hypothetical protein